MLQFRVLPQDDLILVQLAGLVSIEGWSQALQAVGESLPGSGPGKLVLDLTGLVGWLGEHERRQVGELMALHLSRMKRVAAFIQPEKIVGVVEAEARRKGLDLKLFSSRDDAVGWVLS
jgi:hypothetical protein